MNEQYNIVLNGKNIKGNKGEYILDLAARHGVEIPTLCKDPRLEPFSSCYVCVVEVEKMRGLQPACSTRIQEGMVIHTDNEKVKLARKTALSLMASNHYADCVAPCKQTCPAGVDVQGYISYIEKGLYHEAIALIKETNPLPAICGRVCVRPCEVACRRNFLDEGAAVGIDYLKRFAADYDLESENKWKPHIKADTGKEVAVIGAGPGGLAAAFFLRKEGHHVDIFEASPKSGGWLRYGIPPYRLPNEIIDKEVANITDMGVNIHYNKRLGDNVSFKEICGYHAVILAIGSQNGTRVGCEGDDAGNVFSGIDFLKEMEASGKKMDFSGKTVAVVGGGNTAMDCCRTSIRCGAEKVYVIYRRTEKEMPANPIEIHESKIEGVEYLFLTNPKEILKDENGNVKSVVCLKMELGEPDASGRRRPVPKEGSDFEVKVDYILAAIGQKTNINFLEDINQSAPNGELKANKWGDIDADRYTLQTGIPNVFACGDGVTGPATLIEAVGQAKVAALSCHQFLNGMPLKPKAKEFISKKDNFKKQASEEYAGRYSRQLREEMPVLPADARNNFDEVELGYAKEEVATHEANRCLECGCNEYFSCDLKTYCTEYGVDQMEFAGEYKEYAVDFRHPYVEIDNNKCILCARCVRICKEVVGASALGLVQRGFDTHVAPAMGDKLQDTNCESCGTCISACPTGAISQNYAFKPGPVKTETINTICNFCSLGCSVNLHHKSGFVMQTTGAIGLVNTDANICKYPKFGYTYINDSGRITKPLLKKNNEYVEVSYEEAYRLIAEKLQSDSANNMFFAGARLTNEEMYMIRSLSKAAKKSTVTNFHYLGRGNAYSEHPSHNVPISDLEHAKRFFLLGSEVNTENAVLSFMMQNIKFRKNAKIDVYTTKENHAVSHKADYICQIKDYFFFMKAVNYYLLANNKHNMLFINDNCFGFEEYKAKLLKEDYESLVQKGSCCRECVEKFANDYNKEHQSVVIFSEKNVSAHTAVEILNLAMITGKLGKKAAGVISLKEKNNSQGLFDMGMFSNGEIGGKFSVKTLDIRTMLTSKEANNLFVFGEDPVGCASDEKTTFDWFDKAGFVVVADYFMTETAKKADLILPASMPFEIGGSFTNTQRTIQRFEASLPSKLEQTSLQQLQQMLKLIDRTLPSDPDEIFSIFVSELSGNTLKQNDKRFAYAESCGCTHLFHHGCDSVVARFDKEAEKLMEIKN